MKPNREIELSKPPLKRALQPRPTLSVRPSMVSDATCYALLGVTPRRFREQIVPLCAGFVARLGKLALVPLDVVEDKLRALAAEGAHGEGTTIIVHGGTQPQTVDDVLAKLGRRRVGGSR